MFKRLIGFFILAGFLFLVGGCSSDKLKLSNEKETGGENKWEYEYNNDGLDFFIGLPDGFKYYQTQRVETDEFIDIEFFIPSSDLSVKQEVPGYGHVFSVRIFKEVENKEEIASNGEYTKLGSKGDRVYAIKFWDKVPKDWQDRWSSKKEEGIINNFKID